MPKDLNNPVPSRRLAPEEVVLLHHVELADAGWQERLLDQLVIAAVLSAGGPLSFAELISQVEAITGVPPAMDSMQRSLRRLLGSKLLLESSADHYSPSQTTRNDADSRRRQAEAMEAAARRTFESLLREEADGFAAPEPWRWFCDSCLQPLVTVLGARTYELLSTGPGGEDAHASVSRYLEAIPQEYRLGVQRAIDRFFTTAEVAVRQFVLANLHAHLLALAATIPAASLDALQRRLRSGVQLKIFLDTNFLFSLLRLHENPANDAAAELVALLGKIGGRVRVSFYVSPLTVDEARRTLTAYEARLSEIPLTPRLGGIVAQADGQLSGIALRFLNSIRASKRRITAREYFGPYLSDFVTVLRSHGIELYNENVERLSTSQDVVDDILEQQDFEQRRYGDKAKPYEALRHDVTLWHLAAQRRPERLDAPLDAVYWVLTVDYRLLGFDAHKRSRTRAQVPICIHPTALLQMLQLWLPRSAELDQAIFASFRASLPQFFDSAAEEMSIRILRALSRYEDVDDLPAETITRLLVNQALRRRLSAEPEVTKQVELVRDAIVDELARARQEVEEERTKAAELSSANEKLPHAINRTSSAGNWRISWGRNRQESGSWNNGSHRWKLRLMRRRKSIVLDSKPPRLGECGWAMPLLA